MIDEFEVMDEFLTDDICELFRSNTSYWAAISKASQNIKIKDYYNFNFKDMNSHVDQEIYWSDGRKLKMTLNTKTPFHAQAFIEGLEETVYLWNLPFLFPIQFDFDLEVQ